MLTSLIENIQLLNNIVVRRPRENLVCQMEILQFKTSAIGETPNAN